MTYWEKYISEEMTAAQRKKAAKKVMDDLKKEGKKENKVQKKSDYTKYLEKQLEYKKQKYEEQKKRQLEKAKERSSKQSLSKAKQALSSIKQEPISYKDQDPTATKKAIENTARAGVGIAKAIFHALKSRKKKNAKKAEKEIRSRQPEKKEPGRPGRRPNPRPIEDTAPKPTVVNRKSESKTPKRLEGKPEPKRLVPSTKRLTPATKKLPPAGGAPYQASPEPKKETGMSLGQRARRNPELKAALIKTRMEEYSNWKEEFLFEVEKKSNAVEKKKIIDVMKGKNKIEINPTVTEDHKEISSGKKKDDEGYMARVELESMERAIASIRKKIKKSDQQLPAWVQSKITRAADYIDTASEYLQSKEGLSEEKDGKRYCNLCKKRESKSECAYGPDMWEKNTISEMAPLVAALGRVAAGVGARTAARTAVTSGTRSALLSSVKDIAKDKLKNSVRNSLDRASQKVNTAGSAVSPEEGGASAYSKALSNIVGEGVEISEAKKSEMKCNKPKAEAHGSGETGKSHVVKACEGGKEKLIRFGQLGVKGSPKKEGESEEYANRRKRFKTRHAKNIKKGKMSAAYWANKVKW